MVENKRLRREFGSAAAYGWNGTVKAQAALHGRGAHPGQVAWEALDERHLAAHAQLVPARQHGQLCAQRLLAHRAHLGGMLRARAACAIDQQDMIRGRASEAPARRRKHRWQVISLACIA